MARLLKPRSGNTSQNDNFTGVAGELVADIEANELILHDGVKKGGFRLPNKDSIVLDHAGLTGRDKEASHPADAIDWGAYNITPQRIADAVNSEGGVDRTTTRLYLADYVDDPTNVDSVNAGVLALNSKITADGMTIDLSGSYVWPDERIDTQGFNGLLITGGKFQRSSPNEGVEYIVWITESENTLLTGVTLDGASEGITWGSQGIYVRQSVNTIIAGNTFNNIGDGVIRYAHKPSSGPVDATTENVIISNNTFVNCQQVTSNATGAYNAIITNNVLKGSAIKVTQRTQQETGWTIIANNILSDTLDAPITMQGGYRIIVHHNMIEDCGGLFKFYPNNSPFDTENIPNCNVYVTDNQIKTATGDYMLYAEVRGGKQPNSILDLSGDIVIKGNRFERKKGYTNTPKATISMFCYQPGAYYGDNVYIEDNEFVGDHNTCIKFGGDGYITIKQDGKLSIRGNKGSSLYQAMAINVEAQTDGSGSFYLMGNEFVGPQFSVINNNNAVGSLARMHVFDNTMNIINSGGIFSNQLNLTGTSKTPIARSTVVKDNNFIYEDATADGFVISFSTPDASAIGDFDISFLDNFIKASYLTDNIRGIYVSVNSTGKAFSSITFNNNVCDTNIASNSLSDNSDIPVELITFIDKENPNTQVVFSSRTTDGNYFREERTWSDGRHVQSGHNILDFQPPASGNIYLGTDAPDTNYIVLVSPTHSEPLMHTVASKTTTLFKPIFYDKDGAAVSPEFDYYVEWYAR